MRRPAGRQPSLEGNEEDRSVSQALIANVGVVLMFLWRPSPHFRAPYAFRMLATLARVLRQKIHNDSSSEKMSVRALEPAEKGENVV